MRVERFSLFFPPLLLKKKIGETEYAIGALPLGGYVKISGMSPDEDLPDEVRTRAYYSQPVWKRIVVIAAGPFVNLVIAFVVLFVFYGDRSARRPRTGRRSARSRATSRRPGGGSPGRPARLGGRQDRRRRPSSPSVIASHRCPVTPPTDGCRVHTAGAARDQARRQADPRSRSRPIYDPAAKRMLAGLHLRDDARGVPRRRPGAARDRRRLLVRHEADGQPAGAAPQLRSSASRSPAWWA